MAKPQFIGDVSKKSVAIIYKTSRLAYIKKRGSKEELINLKNENDPLIRDLITAHEHNLACIEKVKAAVKALGLSYQVIARLDLKADDLNDKLVITVGGDGTLLDASHYCDHALLLGVNSDPEQSVGALCAAFGENIEAVLTQILNGSFKPSAITRLRIKIGNEYFKTLALNDLLYCHQNPAATSRYLVKKNDGAFESHRSSGMWIAAPAGSTGGIYSSGGQALPIAAEEAIFRVREPYWSDLREPKLLAGSLKADDSLTIKSNMSDGVMFIDGPHKSLALPLGESATISLASKPLWLYDGDRLDITRRKALEQRRAYRTLQNLDHFN